VISVVVYGCSFQNPTSTLPNERRRFHPGHERQYGVCRNLAQIGRGRPEMPRGLYGDRVLLVGAGTIRRDVSTSLICILTLRAARCRARVASCCQQTYIGHGQER
jgi:hypothetical protein